MAVAYLDVQNSFQQAVSSKPKVSQRCSRLWTDGPTCPELLQPQNILAMLNFDVRLAITTCDLKKQNGLVFRAVATT